MLNGTVVNEEGAKRAKEDEKLATENGFSLAPPMYEIGSEVNEMGVDNFRASRREFEAMPTAAEACDKLADTVYRERREDRKVQAPKTAMKDDGFLRAGGRTYPLTERAFAGLTTLVTPGGGSYLRECPPDLRAYNVNEWLKRSFRVDAKATKVAQAKARINGDPVPDDVTVPRELTLRTRMNHRTETREVFSVVGPRYGAHDIDKIADQVAKGVPADARADVVYDGYKARINVLFHSNIEPEKAVAGEIFKAGVSITTADDGTGSIKVAAQVYRNLCLNLIIIDHAKELTVRQKHIGDKNGIAKVVEKGIAQAMKKVEGFAAKWSEATMEDVLAKYDFTDIDEVFRGLIFNKVIHIPGTKPEEMMERLQRAWQREPGYNKTAVVNAVTRAAHEEEWRSWGEVEELERVGGQLLYANVWDVHLPDEIDFNALPY